MWKKIVYYIILSLVTAVCIYLYMVPIDAINVPLRKQANIFITKQKMTPDRVYINAWRNAKLNYIDRTMNGQDWYRWKTRYLKHIKNEQDLKVAVNSMLQSLDDPFSIYLNKVDFETQNNQVNSQISGIGINIIEIADKIVIANIIEGGPAQKSGLKIGDIILSVDGKDVTNLITADVIKLMRGQNSSLVQLKILRNNKIIQKTVKRELVKISNVRHKFIDKDIAYIQIASFMGVFTPREFAEALYKTNDAKGLIIDLRGDLGGILGNAVTMANMMINNGDIIHVKYRNEITIDIPSQGRAFFKDKPIVLLVNRGTASAAEIFAGALKYNKNAILIGQATYGKNSIQQIIAMPNNSGMNLTVARFLTPDGKDIHNTGIQPDYFIPFFTTNYNEQEDSQLNKAQKIMKNLIKKQK